jgi:hypothetical protein
MLGSSWVAAQLAAFQEGLSSIKLVTYSLLVTSHYSHYSHYMPAFIIIFLLLLEFADITINDPIQCNISTTE